LVDHNDWSGWFAISSPPCIWSSSLSFIGRVAKRKKLNFKARKENKYSFLLHELASFWQAFTKQRANKK